MNLFYRMTNVLLIGRLPVRQCSGCGSNPCPATILSDTDIAGCTLVSQGLDMALLCLQVIKVQQILNFKTQATSWDCGLLIVERCIRNIIHMRLKFIIAIDWNIFWARWIQSYIPFYRVSLRFVLVLSSKWSHPFRWCDQNFISVYVCRKPCVINHP